VDITEFLKRAPTWLLAVTLAAAVAILGYSARADNCFRFFGFQFGNCEGVLPKGTVIAFDLPDCPPDWEVVQDYKGRMIVGAGKGNGLSDRPFRVPGGEEAHVLTVDEMPNHRHATGLAALREQVAFDVSNTKYLSIAGNGVFAAWTVALTSPEGGGKEHKIMPPYLPLNICRRK
jgi:hypothetical protein